MAKTEPIGLLEYDFGPAVRAFSTTRSGMEGTGQYAGFNLLHRGQPAPPHVRRNRERLCARLGIGEERLVIPQQTHGTRVAVVADGSEDLAATDGLLTATPGLCIAVSTADCVPLLLADPRQRAVGAVHAGWRGTLGRIAAGAIARMEEAFGTRPADVEVVIGPSISPEAFEVGPEVYEAFRAAAFPMERISRQINGRWHIDLWAANALTLAGAGVSPHRIRPTRICTYAHSDTFFSARRLGLEAGRTLNGIMLLPAS